LLDQERIKLVLFMMSLPYSDVIYMQAFPRECAESFVKGHLRGFAFLGGVPRRITYDNSRNAVSKVVGGRERKVSTEFLRLKSHFLFEDRFCLVRRANERCHVERLLDSRQEWLKSFPQVSLFTPS